MGSRISPVVGLIASEPPGAELFNFSHSHMHIHQAVLERVLGQKERKRFKKLPRLFYCAPLSITQPFLWLNMKSHRTLSFPSHLLLPCMRHL